MSEFQKIINFPTISLYTFPGTNYHIFRMRLRSSALQIQILPRFTINAIIQLLCKQHQFDIPR